VLRAIRVLGGRTTLASLGVVVLAVSGVGTWALLRNTTPPRGNADNVQLPVTAGGAIPITTTAPDVTSGPSTSSGDAVPASGPLNTSLKLGSPDATPSRGAQPNASVPEASSVLLMPLVAAGLFGLALTDRNRRRRRLARVASTESDLRAARVR
jgi:hypothetical protein